MVKRFSNVCILFSFQAALFAALRRCALVDPAAPRTALGYSRCGRTDRGVSARGQVVALNLRTRGPAPDVSPGAPCDDAHEIDYVKVLNGALPADVWATGWAPVPPAFSARFSAAAREYRYFIVEDGGLDFGAMRAAAAGLVLLSLAAIAPVPPAPPAPPLAPPLAAAAEAKGVPFIAPKGVFEARPIIVIGGGGGGIAAASAAA